MSEVGEGSLASEKVPIPQLLLSQSSDKMKILLEKGDSEEKIMMAKALLANGLVSAVEVVDDQCPKVQKSDVEVAQAEETLRQEIERPAAEPVLRPHFFKRLFDTNAQLLEVRRLLAGCMGMDELGARCEQKDACYVNPGVQGEWYYVMQAVEESEVTRRFTDVEFVEMLLDWFPWLCKTTEASAKEEFKRKVAKSISHERGLWKYGKMKEVTRFRDMWARQRALGISYAKLERLYAAAYTGLCQKLIQLKEKIQKERAGH